MTFGYPNEDLFYRICSAEIQGLLWKSKLYSSHLYLFPCHWVHNFYLGSFLGSVFCLQMLMDICPVHFSSVWKIRISVPWLSLPYFPPFLWNLAPLFYFSKSYVSLYLLFQIYLKGFFVAKKKLLLLLSALYPDAWEMGFLLCTFKWRCSVKQNGGWVWVIVLPKFATPRWNLPQQQLVCSYF